MEEAFEKGQGPHRTVEPVMIMMMMISHCIISHFQSFRRSQNCNLDTSGRYFQKRFF
jgi:hypothetical protein